MRRTLVRSRVVRRTCHFGKVSCCSNRSHLSYSRARPGLQHPVLDYLHEFRNGSGFFKTIYFQPCALQNHGIYLLSATGLAFADDQVTEPARMFQLPKGHLSFCQDQLSPYFEPSYPHFAAHEATIVTLLKHSEHHQQGQSKNLKVSF